MSGSIHTFHDEFTNDLESFVKNPIQIEPIASWNPRKPAAPERHLMYGYAAHIEFDAMIYLLEKQNGAFDAIQSMLHIYLDPNVLRNSKRTVVSPIKEQVWLFAYTWFSKYFLHLTEPNILRSEFYKRYHDRFLALMSSMLDMDCEKRITFIEAARRWMPIQFASLCARNAVQDDASAADILMSTPCNRVTDTASTTTDVACGGDGDGAVGERDDPSKKPQQDLIEPRCAPILPPPLSTRLVLNGCVYLGGRNKTRKSPHS